MNEDEKVKPKQYTHIDYIALLTYVMRNHTSVESAIVELELNIARSTVIRNISKLKENGSEEEKKIISLYQDQYVPHMQKDKLPERLQLQIDDLPENIIIKKDELEDLYTKLSIMKEIVDRCNGNISEAARQISAGNTPLGNVTITTAGLIKAGRQYEKVQKQYLKQKADREEREK